jgi:ribonuclease P protein subunit POP4
MLTPETLPRHELIGLQVRVVESNDSTLVGCEGKIVMETKNTLTIEEEEEIENGTRMRTRQVPKAVATFEFALPDSESVTVTGERLLARPARRTERTGGSQWQ